MNRRAWIKNTVVASAGGWIVSQGGVLIREPKIFALGAPKILNPNEFYWVECLNANGGWVDVVSESELRNFKAMPFGVEISRPGLPCMTHEQFVTRFS